MAGAKMDLKRLTAIGIPIVLIIVGLAMVAYGFTKKDVHAINWGLLNAGYTYLALVAGGSILVWGALILGYKGPKGELSKTARLGLLFSIVSLICALLIITVEVTRPTAFWRIFTGFNPISRVAWDAPLITGYIIILAIQLILMIRTAEKGLGRAELALAALGLIVAVIFYSNLAQVYGSMVAVPGWYGAYLVPYFLVSAILLGAAGYVVFTAPYIWRDGELKSFTAYYYGLVIASSVLLLGLLTMWNVVTAWYNPQAWATYSMLVGGAYSALFWGVVIALGVIATFALALYAAIKRNITAILSASTLALIAGFINIYLTIVVHQTKVPEIISSLYRVAEYYVSTSEAFILLGALIIWPSLYALGRALLPLLPEEKPKRLLIFK
ncbi:MAG: NrfD/PsrC family molybdoenzyme membrane anchor subunit [Sulfolobales archaeon]